MGNIIGVMPLAARSCPWLKIDGGYDNVFDEETSNRFAIDTQDDGLCIFAYRTGGRIRCSLHTVALRAGIEPHKLKPFACTLWPLDLSADRGLTLSMRDYAARFPCNKKQRRKGVGISPDLLDSIGKLFGEAACTEIMVAAIKGLSRIRVRLGANEGS